MKYCLNRRWWLHYFVVLFMLALAPVGWALWDTSPAAAQAGETPTAPTWKSVTGLDEALVARWSPPGGEFAWIEVATGVDHACGISAEVTNGQAADHGMVLCWGVDNNGQVSGAPSVEVKAIAAGEHFSCAIKQSDSKPVCWGASSELQEIIDDVPDLAAKEISAGSDTACIIQSSSGSKNNKATCWGENNLILPSKPPDVAVKSLTVGSYFACAIKVSDDTPACWGNSDYLVYRGSNIYPSYAVTDLAVGEDHLCWIKQSDERVDCSADEGLSFWFTTPPTDQFTQIVSGDIFTCGILKSDGNLKC